MHFQPDEELERGNRLDELISQAVRDDAARHPRDEAGPGANEARAEGAPAGEAQDDDRLSHYDSSADDVDVTPK